jgi:hypothetical protein
MAMAAATLAGAGGLFGGAGFLSDAQAAAGPELTVRYARFSRARAPLELVIDWLPRDAAATVWISRAYLDSLEIQSILPSPDFTEVDAGRVHYGFRIREPGARMQLRFTVEPTRAGAVGGRIGVGDGPEVAIRQFAFP